MSTISIIPPDLVAVSIFVLETEGKAEPDDHFFNGSKLLYL